MIEYQSKNIFMIGKQCYNSLILGNYIEVTKIIIMRWEADKRWLYEWCNVYTTIEYQIVIDEKSGVI